MDFFKSKEEKPAAPPMPPAIAAEVAALEAGPLAPAKQGLTAAGAAPAPIDTTDYTVEAADVIEFAYANFSLLYPSLAKVYTDEVRKKLAEKSGAVLKRHGWTLDRLLDRWGPHLGLAMAVQPLVVPTYRAIQADRAADAAQAATAGGEGTAPAQGAAAPPGAPEVPPAPAIKLPE